MTGSASDHLTMQFLTWVAVCPRRYTEAMDVWRTTCPRMTIWEDAVGNGLVRVESGASMKDAQVVITQRGRAWLRRETGASATRS